MGGAKVRNTGGERHRGEGGDHDGWVTGLDWPDGGGRRLCVLACVRACVRAGERKRGEGEWREARRTAACLCCVAWVAGFAFVSLSVGTYGTGQLAFAEAREGWAPRLG